MIIFFKNNTIATLVMGVLISAGACKPSTNSEITTEDLRKSLTYLASGALEGRLPGTEGDKKAADYIAQNLESYGVEPAGEDGYFQYFEVVTSVEAPAGENMLTVGEETAELGKDFTPFSYSTNATVKAELAFAGYGFDIDLDSLQWNDYANIDVKGKWVLVLRNDPEIRNPNSLYIPFSGEKSKVVTAKEKGAAGILFVSGAKVDRKDNLLELEIDQTESNLGLPAFNITRKFANKVFAANGTTIEELETGLTENMKANSFVTTTTVEGTSKVVFHKTKTRNVIGVIEGSDNSLKGEYVVVGAHFDHLGWGGGASSRDPENKAIHYGADDNASGTSGLLEIADKLANADLKRSVLLIAFGAEEMGTIGSKYFTNNPTVAKDKIVAMVNLDMIGRLKDTNEITISGVGTSTEGEHLLKDLLVEKERDLFLSVEYNGFGPSDHANFYVEGIPVFFFNTGAHEDYHTPGDVIEKINFEGMRRVTEYAYDLTENLVNASTALVFQEAGPKGRAKYPKRKS